MAMSVARRSFVDSNKVVSLYGALDGLEVVWGWTDEAQDYPDGTSIHLVVQSNHFGTNKIPRRPILSLSFDRHISGLIGLSDALNQALISSQANNVDPLLLAIGQRAASQAKRDFGNIGPMQALAPSTIERKGHGTIWIETGHAKEQVGFQIRQASL